jgi:hypothetical protein
MNDLIFLFCRSLSLVKRQFLKLISEQQFMIQQIGAIQFC